MSRKVAFSNFGFKCLKCGFENRKNYIQQKLIKDFQNNGT
jgi:hypothetical protein